MNKLLTKQIASLCSIKTPKFLVYDKQKLKSFVQVSKGLGLPFVIKPNSQGCSIGVNLVHTETEYHSALEEALKYEDIVLMEEFILGLEFTVCFLSGEVLPFLSINHSHKFFNYDAKFKSGDTLFDLVNFDGRTNKLIVSQTKKILDFLNINDYCRLDFIMKGNVPYLLELNTLPGLNSYSVFVKAALLYGMSYEEIIMSIINCKK